jgi:hypothetical protein
MLLGFSFTANSYKIFDGKSDLGNPVKGVGLAGKVDEKIFPFLKNIIHKSKM